MTEQRSNLPKNCNLELLGDQSICITYTENQVLSKFQMTPLILLRVHMLKVENSKGDNISMYLKIAAFNIKPVSCYKLFFGAPLKLKRK